VSSPLPPAAGPPSAAAGTAGAQEALRRLLRRDHLSAAETEALFGALMDGHLSEPLKAALLVALAMKGEHADEIAGAAAAMRARVRRIPHRLEGVIDTCGTGGDGRGTFNVSTAAAFVAAAAGAPVAKHGNRAVSSRSGSADVLAALGVRVELEPEEAAEALVRIGLAFLFAPRLHPAVAAVMPVRRELGVRTIFNLLGPLTNPAGARRQLLGVYAPELVPTVARVLAQLGCEHALVVHGDGLDELTLTGPTLVGEVRGQDVAVYEVEPHQVGLERAPLDRLLGGDPQANAARLVAILRGETGPLADMVAYNAGGALYVAGRARTLAAGVETARAVLASGSAYAKLAELRHFGESPRADLA
jgi:anthranilate phosphoribosyltransferase